MFRGLMPPQDSAYTRENMKDINCLEGARSAETFLLSIENEGLFSPGCWGSVISLTGPVAPPLFIKCAGLIEKICCQ